MWVIRQEWLLLYINYFWGCNPSYIRKGFTIFICRIFTVFLMNKMQDPDKLVPVTIFIYLFNF